MSSSTRFGYQPDWAAPLDDRSPGDGSAISSRYACSDSSARLASVAAKYLAFRILGDLRWSSFESSTNNLATRPPSNFEYCSSSSVLIFPKGSDARNTVITPLLNWPSGTGEAGRVLRHAANGKGLLSAPRLRLSGEAP